MSTYQFREENDVEEAAKVPTPTKVWKFEDVYQVTSEAGKFASFKVLITWESGIALFDRAVGDLKVLALELEEAGWTCSDVSREGSGLESFKIVNQFANQLDAQIFVLKCAARLKEISELK